MKSTLKASRDKLKALFAHNSQPTDDPPTVGPEPSDPPPFDEKELAETCANQAGYSVGDEVEGSVTNRQMVNRHYVWASVPNWHQQVLVAVHDHGEWPAGSRIRCQYVQANSDGHLVFNTKEHGPKWKRRGGR